jgi:DNA-binding transcriptional LysR family regulator
MRAEWNITEYLANVPLLRVLPDRTADMDIHAVYPQQLQITARIKTFIDMLIKNARRALQPASIAPSIHL